MKKTSTPDPSDGLRQNIEAEMTRNEFTQPDMARRMKVSDRTWRRWMKKPEEITVGKLICIANILQTTPEILLKGGTRQ